VLLMQHHSTFQRGNVNRKHLRKHLCWGYRFLRDIRSSLSHRYLMGNSNQRCKVASCWSKCWFPRNTWNLLGKCYSYQRWFVQSNLRKFLRDRGLHEGCKHQHLIRKHFRRHHCHHLIQDNDLNPKGLRYSHDNNNQEGTINQILH
jgi:hypothetical protein